MNEPLSPPPGLSCDEIIEWVKEQKRLHPELVAPNIEGIDFSAEYNIQTQEKLNRILVALDEIRERLDRLEFGNKTLGDWEDDEL